MVDSMVLKSSYTSSYTTAMDEIFEGGGVQRDSRQDVPTMAYCGALLDSSTNTGLRWARSEDAALILEKYIQEKLPLSK